LGRPFPLRALLNAWGIEKENEKENENDGTVEIGGGGYLGRSSQALLVTKNATVAPCALAIILFLLLVLFLAFASASDR
jgi:hypothetical protein